MKFTPIKTKRFSPPEDDLLQELTACLSGIKERDVILVSSKVVAIDEGRTVPVGEVDKSELVSKEAEFIIERPYWSTPLTIKNHSFIALAGIDESNGNSHYVLLPEDPFASAKRIHTFLTERFNLKELGVVVTDSCSVPFRYGAVGVALGWWGIEPLKSHVGEEDLFGREMQVERSNLVDGIAAGANVVMGETNECTPVVIARDVPNLTFCNHDTRNQLLSPPQDDIFRILYERFLN